MVDPAWRCGWVDSDEGLEGERARSLRPCDAAIECVLSVLRALFFLLSSVQLPSPLRVVGHLHSTWPVFVGSFVSESKIFKNQLHSTLFLQSPQTHYMLLGHLYTMAPILQACREWCCPSLSLPT